MEQLVIVPIPPLLTLLHEHEEKIGRALSQEEVLEIRDSCVCMNMRQSAAEQLAESRGWRDIDPLNVWDEWNARRSS